MLTRSVLGSTTACSWVIGSLRPAPVGSGVVTAPVLTAGSICSIRGVPSRSFDGRGNYSLGLREQLAFPEIDYDKIDRLRGLEVSIVTTATNDEESKRLLALLGMPFAN